MSQNRYLIVTPAKDEELRIGRTIDAVLQQTILPVKWVIVDDGSTDETAAIVERYRQVHDWISLVSVTRSANRDLGNAEIRAFMRGYRQVQSYPHDFVVKLDADLELPPDYFERLLKEFERNERLGIASGTYLERQNGCWEPIQMPSYHAAGASKMVRVACFREIDGFVLARGWDTIDEIKAQVRGWQTRHFPSIQFKHMRNEGSASGAWSTNILHGEIYQRTGGGLTFFLLKALNRSLVSRPFLLSGLFLLWGYLKSAMSNAPSVLTHEEKTFYRHQLNARLRDAARAFLRRPVPAQHT